MRAATAMKPTHIYHIADIERWQLAKKLGTYEPDSLHEEGFIHCSGPTQIVETANRFYRGKRDLMLLEVRVRDVSEHLRFEPPVQPRGYSTSREGRPEDDELFPHLYTALDPAHVVRVVEWRCNHDGVFTSPP